jgi:endoglucanase
VDATVEFLKTLTDAHGVPGYEQEVRAVLRRYMEPLGSVSQDKLGSLICHQPGVGPAVGGRPTDGGPKVMLASHMDEVGFMVTHITEDGFLKFVQLGGWWDQVLLGHRVVIKTHPGDITGIIGAKPIHLLAMDERKKIVEKNDMYIDIGSSSREETLAAGVRTGDPVIPDSDFVVLANSKTYLAKAFDNRIGCGLAIDVLRHYVDQPHPNHLYGVATVMEEVGVRGATTSVRAVDPDVAIIFEVDIAGDVPGIKSHQSSVKLGAGPSILMYDRGMIPNLKLRDLLINTAAEQDIPIQISGYMAGGSTDGSVIHLHGTGVPAVVVGVPARHIHSHGSIIHRDDYENAVKWMTAVVAKLDADTVADLTA